ncbi:HD domain-containing protein [Paenibacillus arenosi]|uniref:HD domain-containing protein n=1 Tax=Paenibacillus arenosi TaxID=2774142 RepID=A0ABR9B029_9BACL|nr:HD domain-containing protein [Paenibacillus arenosi]MBD8499249.1 HD domain-containing protein [Paenibacillus arenosi]
MVVNDDLDFNKQMLFLIEIDKLKSIERRTKLINGSRQENDAEHSWHLAVMGLILHQYSNQEVDLFKVIKMLLIHDIVEIDAGDTFAYDSTGHLDKFDREQRAATRIFGLLPEHQGAELIDLWLEYDRKETNEAKFAASLDSLQPLIHNHLNQGETWKKNDITSDTVLDRNCKIAKGSERLWEYAQEMIEKSVEQGFLSK